MVFYIYTCFIGALAIITIKKPAAGVVAMLMLFAFEQWAQASTSYFMLNNWITNYLAVGVVLFGLLSKTFRSGIPPIRITPTLMLIILLFLYAFLSTYWSSAYTAAMGRWTVNTPFLILVIFVTPLLLSKTIDLKTLYFSYIFFAAMLAVLLLFTVEWWGRYLVIKGISSSFDPNPNAIGSVGALLFLLSIVVEVDQKKKILGGIKAHTIWSILKWIFALLGVMLALKAQSRGQLLAAGLVVVFALWIKKDKKNIFGLIIWMFSITAIVLVAYMSYSYVINEQALVSDEKRWTFEKMLDDLALRFEASLVMLHVWSRDAFSIIFGLGNYAAYSYVGNYIHIIPLEILTEEGLFGFAIFLAIIALTLRNILFLFRVVDKQSRSYMICLVAFFFVEFVLYFKQGSLPISPNLYLTIVLIDRLRIHEYKLMSYKKARLSSSLSATKISQSPGFTTNKGV